MFHIAAFHILDLSFFLVLDRRGLKKTPSIITLEFILNALGIAVRTL